MGKAVYTSQPDLLFFPLSSYLFRWCCIYDPPEPHTLSSVNQSMLWARLKNRIVGISFRCTGPFDNSDNCETLSKRVFPSNQLASQHLKLHRLLTKQSHTPIGNEVPRGHTYIKTRIIILLHAMLTHSF